MFWKLRHCWTATDTPIWLCWACRAFGPMMMANKTLRIFVFFFISKSTTVKEKVAPKANRNWFVFYKHRAALADIFRNNDKGRCHNIWIAFKCWFQGLRLFFAPCNRLTRCLPFKISCWCGFPYFEQFNFSTALFANIGPVWRRLTVRIRSTLFNHNDSRAQRTEQRKHATCTFLPPHFVRSNNR